jgi:Zn-dependent peptidase ImmA (M78 family)
MLADDRERNLCEESESLATAERHRLELPDGPIEDLAQLLDDRGIKVIEWDRPAGMHAGAFLFDSDTGPALLSLAPAGSAASRFILAHEYCHLLADVDPYENRFCLHGSGDGCAEARFGGRLPGERMPGDEHECFGRPESRADHFARAFLLPKDHFSRTLGDFGEGGRRGFHLQRLNELAFYYGVDTPVVLNRLADLGFLPASEAAAMATCRELARAPLATPPVATPPIAERPITSRPDAVHPAAPKSAQALETLPVRFVHLCLTLFVSRIAARDHLSRLLDVDARAVNRLIGWLDLPGGFRERRSSESSGWSGPLAN